jgi:hypothetical protein
MPEPPGALAEPLGALMPPAAGASGAGGVAGGAEGGADSGGLPAPAPPVVDLPASLQPVSATKASSAMASSSRLVAFANQEGKSTGFEACAREFCSA